MIEHDVLVGVEETGGAERAALLQSIFESSTEHAIVALDLDGVVLAWNDGARRIYGYDAIEVVGRISPMHHPDERNGARVRAVLSEVQGSGRWSGELRRTRKDGSEFTAFVTITLRRNARGEAVGYIVISGDVTEEQRVVRELRESQEYNRLLIESNVDALVTTDPLGIISDVNRQMCEMTGATREELVGSPFKRYVTDPKLADDCIRKVVSENRLTNYELVMLSRTGKTTVVSYNATTFRSADKLKGVFAAARDITEQKQLEDDLRQAQNYNRGLFEASVDALVTIDPELRITDVNEQTVRITGYSREELIDSPFPDYFTEPERASAVVQKTLADGFVTNYGIGLRSKSGAETIVSFNASVFKDTEGNIRGVFASARDITDQRRLEEQIRAQNRELTEATGFMNNVLESSTEYSIIAKDLDGTILTWNEGARRNYGYTAEEMVEKQNSQILHTPADLASGRVERFFETALETGKAEGVFERVRKGSERFTASVAVTLRRDASGKPIGYVLISKDITEQKQLEEQLRRKNEELEEQNRRVQQANRLKSEFLANMSHELRTPLNGIIGFSELMHDGKVGPVSADHKEYLGDILTSSRHLLQLINDVLDLAKVESGKMRFRPEAVHLTKLVGEVRDILRTLTAEKRIRLTLDLDPALDPIVADPAKLKQVLYNYLSNALKFTPEEGRVTVRARLEGDARFRLEVEDSGIGIRAEDFDRLFIEFQQLDASSAKKYQGTGLGLALTRRIIEAQGGEVGVTSVLGTGSTFYAVLPRVALGDVAELTETVAGLPGAQRVLVIEDDPRDRAWVVATLTSAGYAVEAVATGDAAILAAGARPFDALTLDLLLPDMSGWDVLRTIRQSALNHDVPAIVTTVVGDKGVLGFAIHDFLNKPVQAVDLLSALRRLRPHPGAELTLLVVDDDPNMAKLIGAAVRAIGYRVVAVGDGESALLAAEAAPPSAVLLDLLMPGIDGFEFLHRFRSTAIGRVTPVIVWTVKDLTPAEQARLLASAQAIVSKGAGSTDAILAELQRYLLHWGAAHVG